jgi:hypothetical protein
VSTSLLSGPSCRSIQRSGRRRLACAPRLVESAMTRPSRRALNQEVGRLRGHCSAVVQDIAAPCSGSRERLLRLRGRSALGCRYRPRDPRCSPAGAVGTPMYLSLGIVASAPKRYSSGMGSAAAGYRPRAPEHGALHTVVRTHLEAFLREAAEQADGAGLPRFVEDEFRDFLTVSVSRAARASTSCRWSVKHSAPLPYELENAGTEAMCQEPAARTCTGPGRRGDSF